MIGAVIGLGPRTGTSYVMKRLYEAGFKVYWEEDEWPDSDRVGGHFETPRERLPAIQDRIVKVWPGAHHDTLIERAAVLYRNQADQLRSIEKQMEREREFRYRAEDIVRYCYRALDGFTAGRTLAVMTEDIDDRLEEIFDFFREGLIYASSSDCRSSYRSRWYSD